MLYLLTSSNSFPHQKIEKVRVINLTQGGLKAMEELEKLEEDRRNENVGVMLDKKRSGRRKERRSAMPKGTASNEMCTFLILNISSSIDSCEYDCVPESVWECESGCYCGTGNCGDDGEYSCGDNIL